MDESKNPFKEQEENIEENIENEKNSDDDKNQESNEEIKAQDSEENSSEETVEKNDFEEKYEELNNKYIRLAADFDNFRKRTVQEKEELSTFAKAEVLKKLTMVLDTFDRAHEHLKEIDNCQTVKDSYEVAYKQLLDTLSKIGLTEIEALGKEFNPNEHEAITQIPTDEYEPDCVAMVAQKGYKLADRVIRPALVGVAKKKDE